MNKNNKQSYLKQEHSNYQHQDGTCLCSVCLCGNCRCKPKPIVTHFEPNMKSNYESDFHAHPIEQPLRPSRIMALEKRKSISTHSEYQEEFHTKPIAQNVQARGRANSFALGIPFCSVNRYAMDYQNTPSNPPTLIKPVNQIQLLPLNQTDISQYKREYKPKPIDRDGFMNISKMMSKRLHINSKDKMVYINSSYGNQYKLHQNVPVVKRLPQQPSLVPFGLSNVGVNIFSSQYQQDYYSKQGDRCEADIKLEELSRQI